MIDDGIAAELLNVAEDPAITAMLPSYIFKTKKPL